MRFASYAAVFSTLVRIDECSVDSPSDAPRWMLIEARPDDDGGPRLTGRHVGGLHESLRSADPSGREGADLLD
jgi:hypothetical protein